MAETPVDPILAARGLRLLFDLPGGAVSALRGVDLALARGETLALVGESGSGKTVTALLLLWLLPSPPARLLGGEAWFQGRELLGGEGREARRVRGGGLAMVFQDPLSALNPFLTAGAQVAGAVRLHQGVTSHQARRRAQELFQEVGIPDPGRRLQAFPHQLSGGLRQRVLIAMALAGDPDVLIADEPTTALDVTVQAQILELFARLVRERGTSLLLITHDLGVVAGLADRVSVLYAGKVVEEAPSRDFFGGPRHPYAQGLLRAVPRLDHRPGQELATIPGFPPHPSRLPSGCAFHPRCPSAVLECSQLEPELRGVAPGRSSACHLEPSRPGGAKG